MEEIDKFISEGIDDGIFKPLSRPGKMPVPKIFMQKIVKHDGAKMFQTDGEISDAKDDRVFLEVEPAVKNDEPGLHIGFCNFKNIDSKHNSPSPRFDAYILLSEFDKFLEEYIKWRENDKGNTN